MVAERINLSDFSPARQQTLLALFAQEEAAETFVARLRELEIEPRDVTLIGVALGEPPKRLTALPYTKAPNTSRYTTIGILGGGFIALLIGLTLYVADFLHLSFLEAMLIHTLALILLGGVIGGAVGAILASVEARHTVTTLPPQTTDGFLVVVKTPSYLAVQCETLARELGAKKVMP
jgi:uncharacterized membrane protein YsdA (DUF1294 family)